ncbi:MAG: DUF4270 family protein [Bacteroidales bacterium]|nr:DUF4270 family protein [Bacteroidales bacterium]
MKKTFFFLAVVLIFSIFYSCNERYNIGSNILPNNDFLNINIIDTVEVFLTTEQSMPIISTNPNYLLVGQHDDPLFGITDASFMTQFRQTSYPLWGDTAILDSVCIILPLAIDDDYYYGNNSNAELNLSVYEVIDTINKTAYSDQNPNDYTDYNLLGETDVYKKHFWGKRVNDEGDTVDVDSLALVIRLDDAFGQRLIDDTDGYFENSVSYFHEIFKGVYITNNSDDPGIYRINTDNTSNQNFGLVIFYHFAHSQNIERDFCLPLSTSCGRFNMFSHDYTNAVFYDQLQDSTIIDQNAYLQAMGGTMVKFSAPGLLNLDSMVINKAELIFKTNSSLAGDFSPLNEIWLAGVDTGQTIVRFQEFYASTYQGAIIDNQEYKFDVTRIMQSYIDGLYQNSFFDFYLMDLSGASAFNRSVITNGNNNNPPKIVITYTKIQ